MYVSVITVMKSTEVQTLRAVIPTACTDDASIVGLHVCSLHLDIVRPALSFRL